MLSGTLVRPLLEYSSAAWVHNLQRIQWRAARFVTRDYCRTTSVTSLLSQLNGHFCPQVEETVVTRSSIIFLQYQLGRFALFPSNQLIRPIEVYTFVYSHGLIQVFFSAAYHSQLELSTLLPMEQTVS